MKKIPITIDDFAKVRKGGYYFVDKSRFIEEVDSSFVQIIAKPSGFGKTMMISMLKQFYSMHTKENAWMFDGLKIQENKEVMAKQNKYPTICMSFHDFDCQSYEEFRAYYARKIMHVVSQFDVLRESEKIWDIMKIELNQDYTKSSRIDLDYALKHITDCLKEHYNEDVIVLLDDYDKPFYLTRGESYHQEISDFLMGVFSCTFKTNFSLEKAVLMGLYTPLKGSEISGFNNYVTDTVLSYKYKEVFGFEDNEIDELLEYYGMEETKEQLYEKCGNYSMGDCVVYRPEHVMKFLEMMRIYKNR